MNQHSAGLAIIFAGAVVVVIGLLVWSGALRWFGSLPGDIRIERGSARFYFPLVSMLLVSVVVSLLFRVARRYLHLP